jgi:hypothetical protein
MTLVMTRIMKMETGELTFDDGPIRTMMMLMDREAKLYGFDRAGLGTGNRAEWLSKAPTSDIVEEAKKYGIPIPAEF